ncbi:MAG: nucleotidyl transferase AbiEii/AbiGii toxin family protein [Gemmatimonadota bacterium]
MLQELGRLGEAYLVVKGGVNLRFFFGSVRYSEDLDLDANPSSSVAVRDLIRGLFEDRGLARRLRELGIRQLDPGEGPNKDTATTFRYKFGIVMTGDVRHPTRIEVSYRDRFAGDEVVVEAILPSVTRAYLTDAEQRLLIPHYSRTASVRQKIVALARRKVVQSRDVFDLHSLTAGQRDQIVASRLRDSIPPEDLFEAHRRTLEIPYEEYRGQVLEFLEMEERSQFEGEAVWDDLRLDVAEFIEDIAR